MSTNTPIHTYFIPWQSILALRAINQPVVLAQTIQTLLRMAHGEVNAGEPAFSVQLTLEVSTDDNSLTNRVDGIKLDYACGPRSVVSL